MFREKESPKKWFISEKIELKDSDIHGKGVFAKTHISKFEIIESAPVVIAHVDTMHTLNEFCCEPGVRHIFMDYVFSFGPGKIAFPLGWAGIYNHSPEPNAFWDVISEEDNLPGYGREVDKKSGYNALIFRAKRDLEPGEEICTRYTPFANQLWFSGDDDNSYGTFDPYMQSLSRPSTMTSKIASDLDSYVAGKEITQKKNKEYLK